MTSRQAPHCGLAPRCLWLLGAVLLMDASARPANHSSARERVGNREENEILPPDHLNGVKLEMDGHLNKDFHQEVFLGKDTDGFEEDAEPRRSRRKLMVIFSKHDRAPVSELQSCYQGLIVSPRVDLNTDRRISAKEMQRWIMEKTAEHFQEAIAESRAHFRAVDPDGDGRVSWDEYKVKFLASKGHDEREVADKIKNKWDLNVDEETQEVLENLKDRWYQADNPPPDLLLTESEFLSFLHPEHSRGMLQFMVKEIIRDLDQDGDKQLSLSEFISLPVGTVENPQGQDVDDGWVRDRKREFEELIDANHDGIVTVAELEDYMDPMNEFSALNEAKQMIAIADENQNHYLEPEEVLKYSEFFTGSKLVDYARSVHEEF
ncbi:45 kDa calcium-binding protein isoform X1 [Physeter macrocephalus]|uniref:45 kDa calcium-binding protein n=1 Tax=Physeter macrocephalus TaxID=9755 RepID=A0A455BIQ0_PHYMC|nr:45 kDa calcium-binding protein isoform X1 [Physeter catodon]|eukprot:XP_028343816.1 45 kDa calcium-binding protein isoform X1 [Physeter catodon]